MGKERGEEGGSVCVYIRTHLDVFYCPPEPSLLLGTAVPALALSVAMPHGGYRYAHVPGGETKDKRDEVTILHELVAKLELQSNLP